MPSQKWKNIPGFERISINEAGTKVRKRREGSRKHDLLSTRDNNGYEILSTKRENTVLKIKKHWSLHELQMIANNMPRPDGMVVDHKDCDTKNNRVENLHWVTQAQNNALSRQRSSQPVNAAAKPAPAKRKAPKKKLATARQKRYLNSKNIAFHKGITKTEALHLIVVSKKAGQPMSETQVKFMGLAGIQIPQGMTFDMAFWEIQNLRVADKAKYDETWRIIRGR